MTVTATTGPSQNMQALAKANRVRLARAKLRHDIAEGDLHVAGVLADIPDEAQTLEVSELLMCQHRWGRTRARRACETVGVRENKPLGEMTDRQRAELARLLLS